MVPTRISDEEIDRRGDLLYQSRIRSLVERPENVGRQVVIDVETGDYEVHADGLAASRRLLLRHPGAALYGARSGYSAVYTLGGILEPTQPKCPCAVYETDYAVYDEVHQNARHLA